MPEKRPVIGILDVGKTNKKAFLFDEDYQIVAEKADALVETVDEDGFPCEDIAQLCQWVKDALAWFANQAEWECRAINVSAYGASLVHVDINGNPLTPLYNYLKPFPEGLKRGFVRGNSGHQVWLESASPDLGSLNSGLQLFRLKYENPHIFTQVKYSNHLPQFIAGLIHGRWNSELTSVGCHTALWDFKRHAYHDWVSREHLETKLAPIVPTDSIYLTQIAERDVVVGAGIHDSSAALVPYINQFKKNFVLISTGTWNISLNPFGQKALTEEDLSHDCLCYLNQNGKSVRASRIFAGHELNEQLKRLADYFHVNSIDHSQVRFQRKYVSSQSSKIHDAQGLARSGFEDRDLKQFGTFEEAYHQLLADLVWLQYDATQRVIEHTTGTLFVDGGFSENQVFMNLLAAAFPDQEVYAAAIHQASALGAAQVIHRHWNPLEMRSNKIKIIRYPA